METHAFRAKRERRPVCTGKQAGHRAHCWPNRELYNKAVQRHLPGKLHFTPLSSQSKETPGEGKQIHVLPEKAKGWCELARPKFKFMLTSFQIAAAPVKQGNFVIFSGALELQMKRKMYVSNESLPFWTRENLADLKMVGLLSWVFEKGIEMCDEMLFLFSVMPHAKPLIVLKQISPNSEQNLEPPLPCH